MKYSEQTQKVIDCYQIALSAFLREHMDGSKIVSYLAGNKTALLDDINMALNLDFEDWEPKQIMILAGDLATQIAEMAGCVSALEELKGGF